MLMLNYASEELKKEAKYRRIYHVLKKTCYFFVALIFFVSAIMYSAKIFLTKEYNSLVKEKDSLTSSFAAQNTILKETNQKIKAVEEIERNITPILDNLKQLSDNKIENVKFTSLKIDLINNKITVIANAQTRDELMKYKEILQNIKSYKELKFITPDLTEKNNVNFNFETKF